MARPGYMNCLNRIFDGEDYLKWTTITAVVEFSGGYTGRRFTEEGEDSEDGSLGGTGTLILTRSETPFDSKLPPTRAAQGVLGGEFMTYRRRCGCPGIILGLGEEGDPAPLGTINISVTYHPDPASEEEATTVNDSGPVQIDLVLVPDHDDLCPIGEVQIATFSGASVIGGTELLSGAESADLTTGGPFGLTVGANDIFEQTITRGIQDPVGGIDTIGSESFTFILTVAI